MKTFKKKIDLGKIDAYGRGRRINAAHVEVEWRLEFKFVGGREIAFWEFSAMGAIWNASHTDWISGGQNLDHLNTFSSIRNNPKFREIFALWNSYHLNGMTAGSPAQESAKKDFKVDRAAATWCWYDKNDINENVDRFGRHVTDDESTAKAAEAAGHYVKKETGDYNDQLSVFLARRGLYTDTSFIYEGEPYKYGSAWLITEIPEADKKRIRAIMEITRADEEKAEAEGREELKALEKSA